MTQLSVHTEGLTVVAGCVKSGKTDLLLTLLRHADIANYKSLLFTHSLGHGADKKVVISRDKNEREAIVVDNSFEILEHVEDGTNLVGIDNVHLMDRNIIDFCNHLVGKGTDVIVAGLNLDFKADPFDSMAQLLVYADHIVHTKAVCEVCGNDATRSQRLYLSDGVEAPRRGPRIVPEGSNTFRNEARCHKHYRPPQ